MVKVLYSTGVPDNGGPAATLLIDIESTDLSTIPPESTVLRTGFGAPFSLLPDRVIELVLSVETEALSRAGVTAGGLAVDDWWDDRLIEICDRLQIPAIISPRVVRSGTLARFHHTRPVFESRQVDPGLSTPFPGVPPPGPAILERPSIEPDPTDTDMTLLRRTFTRLMSRLPERPGAATLKVLPGAVNGSAFLPGSAVAERLRQRQAMLRLRAAMAEDQRRGDNWGRLRRVDWDGDGIEELEIETARFLGIYDPESASLATLADKRANWPISSIPGDPGWIILQHLAHPDADLSPSSTYVITGLEEAKDRLAMTAETGDGTIRTRLSVQGPTVTIDLDLTGHEEGLVGPELSLLLDHPRVRIDGSEWRAVEGPSASTGHKFRYADDGHSVLMTSLTPVTMFQRLVEGGLIVWAHWTTDGTSSHSMIIEFSD